MSYRAAAIEKELRTERATVPLCHDARSRARNLQISLLASSSSAAQGCECAMLYPVDTQQRHNHSEGQRQEDTHPPAPFGRCCSMFTTVARTEAVLPSLLSVVKSPFGDLLSPQTYYKRRHDAPPPSLKGCLSKDAPLAVRVWAFGGEGCLSERGWCGGGRTEEGSIIPRKSSLLLSFPAAHAAPETAVGSQKSSSLVGSPTFS